MDTSIIYALICLIVAILVVAGLRWFDVTESATIGVVLVAPLLIWAINSKAVQKITAGGVSVEFSEVAEQPVKREPILDLSEGIQSIQKEGTSEIERKVAALKPGTPLSLVIDIDRQNYYQADAILAYLQALLIYDPDTEVILLDNRGRYIASASASRVAAFLDPPAFLEGQVQGIGKNNRERLQGVIGAQDENQWLALPGFTKLAISSESSNVDALAVLDKNSLKSAVIVDGDRKPVGIAQRDAIVAHLVSELASAKVK